MRMAEELADAKEMLENVFYWDTCPEDYKHRIMKICSDVDFPIDEDE
jgi:hypothetical protein